MDSVELLPEEFWFYRVYSELTLALVHQVNNELTGALFLTELIQEEDSGMSVGDISTDLEASIRKVIHLNERITDAHSPDWIDPQDADRRVDEPGYFLSECLSFLRLLLSSTVALRVEAPSAKLHSEFFSKKEIQLMLGAVGLLLNPTSAREPGELAIAFESATSAWVFLPNYSSCSLRNETHWETCPGFMALKHRVQRLGGKVEFYPTPDDAAHPGLRLIFS